MGMEAWADGAISCRRYADKCAGVLRQRGLPHQALALALDARDKDALQPITQGLIAAAEGPVASAAGPATVGGLLDPA